MKTLKAALAVLLMSILPGAGCGSGSAATSSKPASGTTTAMVVETTTGILRYSVDHGSHEHRTRSTCFLSGSLAGPFHHRAANLSNAHNKRHDGLF